MINCEKPVQLNAMCSLDTNTDSKLTAGLPALPNYQQCNNVGENVANVTSNNILVTQGSGNLKTNTATVTVLPKTQTVLPTQHIQNLQQQQHDNNLLQQYYLNEINKEIDEEDQGCFCCNSDDDCSDDDDRQIKNKEQKKKLFRTMCKNSFLFVILIIYAFFGSLIFLLIENNRIITNNNNRKQNEINNTALNKLLDVNIRNKVVENIWDITVNLNILYRENWTRLAEKEMSRFQYDIVKQLSKEIKLYGGYPPLTSGKDDNPAAAILEFNEIPIEWNLAKTFFYSLSILTTIGYANTYDNKSQSTKLITIIYTIIGIPIFLIYVSNIGLILARFAKNCFTHSMCCCLCSKCGYCCYDEILMEEKERRMRLKRQRNEFKKELEKGKLEQPYYLNINYLHEYNNFKYKTRDIQKRTEKTKLIAPLVFSILVICVYLLFGSVIIYKLEPGTWKLLDCLFYTFSLLTTIGVNDQIIPARSNLRMVNNSSTSIIWFVAFYLLIGLSFNSMFLNIIFDIVRNRIRNKKKRRSHSSNKLIEMSKMNASNEYIQTPNTIS